MCTDKFGLTGTTMNDSQLTFKVAHCCLGATFEKTLKIRVCPVVSSLNLFAHLLSHKYKTEQATAVFGRRLACYRRVAKVQLPSV